MIVLILALLAAPEPPSEVDQREADLFGAPEAPRTSTTATTAARRPEAAILPPEPIDQMAARAESSNNPLAIGGQLYLRLDYLTSESGNSSTFPLSSPNFLDVYLDARPNDRVRAYVQGRLYFDPTIAAAPAQRPIDLLTQAALGAGQMMTTGANATTLLGKPPDAIRVLLDQMWLKTDVARTVFITAGRQRIKWGSGRFWNPTDFLNAEKKDPLAVFDERLGVTLLKIHIPVERLGWNFYAIGTFDEANSIEQVGGALRAEFLIAETELALSMALRKDRPQRFGADITSGLGPFDLRLEAAFLTNDKETFYRGSYRLPADIPGSGISDFVAPEEFRRNNDVIVQVVAGAEVTITYSDQGKLILGAEYFYNDAGYDSSKYYTYLFLVSRFTPFYLGKHYASGYAVLNAPFRWDNTSFVLSELANLSDRTFVTRLDYAVRVLSWLDVNAFGAFYYGDQGEFHLSVDFPALSTVPGLANGIHQPARLFEIGGGIRCRM